MSIKIFPSILSADFANLQRDIEAVPSADGLHVDVMDAHFVPNLTIGLPVVTSLRRATDAFLDVHLMIDDPNRWGPAYADAGANSVTFHLEAATAPIRLICDLHERGARAGVAIKPTTPVDAVADFIEHLDMLLIMTVEPGFGGQGFLDFTLPKIADARALIDHAGADVWLQVDGGISLATIDPVIGAGADCFVAGSAVFGADDADAVVRALKARGEAPREIKPHPWAQRALTAHEDA